MIARETSRLEIGGRVIGPGRPAYLIAELSANHNGSYERAAAIVRAAAEAGADAIKLQTYTADTMTLDLDEPMFRIEGEGLWAGRSLYDLYQEASTPWEWQPRLKSLAESRGMACLSSPFDESAVDFLEGMGIAAYKIASFEIVDLPLIERVAATGKPVIISTGMACLAEIEAAVATARRGGASGVALLKCTSAYPAPVEQVNLRTLPNMAAAFGVVAGLSDHTLGIAVPVGAVALGARIVEKHLTLSRDEAGPDSAFSLEPHEFAEMVSAVRDVEAALGKVSYRAASSEQENLQFRRSLFVVADVAAGETFTRDNVRAIRPGYGLPPGALGDVLGRTAACEVSRGTPLSWDLVAARTERASSRDA